jgi:predicted permease
MDEWRKRLREAIAEWELAPEEQAAIADEMEEHLEQKLSELAPRIGHAAALERIMDEVNDPALRVARVRPHHVPAASVAAARTRGRGWLGIGRDLRYGWRALGASRGTTAMAIVALSLGIGLTTVMFSIIYGTLVRGLPFEDAGRIALIGESSPARGGPPDAMPMHDFYVYRDAQRSFESFGAYTPTTLNMSGDERPERVESVRISASALALPRVRPELGRLFRTDDETPGGELVAILSHALWRDHYALDPSVIGRAIRVNGQPATIVGVMPEGFRYPNEAKLWVPLRLDPAAVPWGSGPFLSAVGRLRSGVSLERANAELAAISARIAAEHPRSSEGVRAIAQPFIHGVIRKQIFALLYAMFGAVGLVFLVACTNVANLLLGRAAHRSREVAIRSALGASRTAIARQFLAEALVLSIVAAALGALVAQAGIVAFREATANTHWPFWTDIRLHPQVFVFIALVALVASIISGLLPALTAARSDITEVLKDQSLGSSSLRSGKLSRALVVFELALSCTLLVVAALITRSVMNLRSLDPGFRTQGILTGRVTLTARDQVRRTAFFERLEDGIARIPGATATSLSSDLPGTGWGQRDIAIEGARYAPGSMRPAVRHLAVTPQFFETFDVEVIRGRAITAEDRAGSLPVAVVDQRFAREHFPGMDPLGRRVNLAPGDSVAEWVTVVGVMPTLYAASLQDPWPAELLTAFAQEREGAASIAIRTSGDPAALAQPLRELVASLDADLPVYSLSTMSDALSEWAWPERIFGGLFVVFGISALVLASIGLYAVLAFTVSRRERELGIRLALGARAGEVVRLVLRDGAAQLLEGMGIGLLLGIVAARAARAVLFGVQPGDPVTIAAVVVTLAATGFVASIAPALRATKADPVRSLRSE